MNRPGEHPLRLFLIPMAAALADPATTEVVVNRPCEFGVEAHGKWTWHDAPSLDALRCHAIGSLAAAMMRQDVGPSQPLCASVLPDGQRIQVCLPPATAPGIVSLTVRKPPTSAPSMDVLADGGLFSATTGTHLAPHPADAELVALHAAGDWRRFFPLAVLARKNIVAAGATGSGKTTFARALLQCIPSDERILTIEDTPEFGTLPQRNAVSLYYSKGDQGMARIKAEDLIEAALRMRPDRILLQEVRDAGAGAAFVRGVATGHPGSITTCHADSPDGAFDVLRRFLADPEARSIIRSTIDIVVHCARDPYRITQVYFDPAAKLAALNPRQIAA